MAHIELPDGAPGIRGPMMAYPTTSSLLNELAAVLLQDPHSLTPGEREVIATAASHQNSCEYCTSIHRAIAIAHLHGDAPFVDNIIATNNDLTPVSKLDALCRIAKATASLELNTIDDSMDHARSFGATDTEIHDAVAIGAAFSMFNRYVDGLATSVPTQPAAYEEMGRNRAAQGYRTIIWTLFLLLGMSPSLLAGDGSILVRLVCPEDSERVRYVRVIDSAAKRQAITKADGSARLTNIPAGPRAISLKGIGIRDTTVRNVNVLEGTTTDLIVEVTAQDYRSQDVVVYGASKRLEKITETPAAVTILNEQEIQQKARGNQLGAALEGLTGVDIVRNGATDFNVNTRGFNNSTNRRLLVLVDGRDVSLQQIGAVEWNSFASSLNDVAAIELVRGPAASLYGANAFNGVLSIRTKSPKESVGTEVSLLGGDYNTMRGDVRHAGLLGDLSYKVTLGHSRSLNLAQNRTDSASIVSEYPSLWPATRELNALSFDDRQTFATYGTVRMDYDVTPSSVLTGEVGYSQFGNEVMLAGSGRIHVPQSEKPFARLAYHSDDVHIQTSYNARRTVDTMRILAAPPGTIILDDSYDLSVDAQYNGTVVNDIEYVVGGQAQYMSIASDNTVFPNEPILARTAGIYGQITAKPLSAVTVVATARVDVANIFPTQFSPRMAVLYSPLENHTVRASIGRSFQRANFSELFRRYTFRPALNDQGRPVNFRPVNTRINDTLSSLTGSQQNVDLGLFSTSITSPTDPRGIQPMALGVGNRDLNVEENVGYEFGYTASLTPRLRVGVDVYYNRLRNFISGFLPGVNENYAMWTSATVLPENLRQYSSLVDSIVYAALSPQDRPRFTTEGGTAAFVVSNTNLGLVEQFGVEIDVRYSLLAELELSANYSYYRANLLEARTNNPFLATGDMLLSPNTSPHRVNLALSYNAPLEWDASIQLRYVEGFAWLAGDFRGFVPSYAVVNINAGYFVTDAIRAGLVVTNLFDRRHYQVYGGSIIPRLTYLSVSMTL